MSLVEPLEFYLVPMTPELVFEATIDSLSEPNTINFSGAIATGTVHPMAGMTLRLYKDGFADDDVNIIGRPAQRVRSVPTGSATGQIVIGEDDEFFLNAEAGDTVRILNEFRLWPKFPRFIQNGTNVTQYEDYDIEYTDQLQNYRPTAVAGPPAVVWLKNGQAQASFVGENSFVLSGSISSVLWRAYGSTEDTSTSTGTEASPVVFTWTQAGRWLVSLTVTDNNSNTHTAYTYAVVIDPDNIDDIAYRDFDAINEKFDWQQGGGTCGFTVEGAAGKGIFSDEMRILHVYRGNLTTPTATWPNRANLLFDGWIVANSVRQNLNNGDVQFRATTIDGVMKKLTMFPTSLTYRSGPTEWTQAADLDVDRVCHYVYHYRSTLASMTPITRSNYSGLIGRQDFGEQNLFAAVQNGLMRSVWGQLVSSHQSVLYHHIDLMVLESADRPNYGAVRKAINKTVWIGDATIEESHDYSWVANRVKSSGVYYTGGDYDDICPLFSEAPGDAPLSYGGEASFDRLILTGQTELNQRTGYKLAQLKKRLQAVRLQFINDGSFGIVPQDRFPLTVLASDNDRGLAIPGDRAVARSVSRQYDHTNGIMTIDVTFEPETTGNNGVTVIMPCEPPAQKTNTELQPLIPLNPQPSDDRPLTAIAVATNANSFYFANGVPADWERRVSGLVNGQIILNDMVRDPWTYVLSGGYNPDRVIVWGCGTGFVVRSEDSGQNWVTRSGGFPNVTWGADSEQAYTGIDFINLIISDFIANDIYVLGRWQSGGLWRSAIYYSFDGFNWSTYTLEGNTEVKGLGLAIDRGNGVTLWVTTWESDDTLYLRRIELPVFTESGKYSMGSATEAQLGDTYIAYPSCAWSKTDQIFIFGRMQGPQGLANPSHIIKSNNRGDSWSVVDSTWGNDLCDAFASDAEEFYYAVRRSLIPGLL